MTPIVRIEAGGPTKRVRVDYTIGDEALATRLAQAAVPIAVELDRATRAVRDARTDG